MRLKKGSQLKVAPAPPFTLPAKALYQLSARVVSQIATKQCAR